MMKKFTSYYSGRMLIVIMAVCLTMTPTFAQSPVAVNGALKVSGNKILNKNNQPVSFSGPSYFWSNTGWGAERFYNAGVVNYFRSNWNAGIIRAAMGINEPGGYNADPAGNKARVKAVVDAAISSGMYVIIDWHTHHAEDYRQSAIDFFSEMARTYGTRENVIYEIYNEPLAVSWSSTIKPYAEAVIGAIRAIDPDNLIVVGTPNWSQDVDVAANDPITRYSNIAYTLHFYAATHKADLRTKASTALSRGLALFVTEWGTCEAQGDGFVNEASTNEWVAFMKQNNISNCNWALNDKDISSRGLVESSSILRKGVNSTGAWTDADLTPSGRIVKNIVLGWGGTPPGCTTVNLPATIQAESFCSMSGIQLEPTTDSGGGQNVGYIDLNDWMVYRVNVPSTGNYTFSYRVASLNGGGRIRLEREGGSTVYGTINVPSTGGWQNWQTISHTVQLPAGEQNIAIAAAAGGFNINWFSATGDQNFSQTVQAENYSLMTGVRTENTSDVGGGLNVGYIDNNDWMKYSSITIPQTGLYLVEYRVASIFNTGRLTLDLNAGTIVLGSANIPNTNGWQNWNTISHVVSINAGTYDFGIFANTGGWNINWWRISKAGTGARIASSPEFSNEDDGMSLKLYPNPAATHLNIDGLTETMNDIRIYDLAGRELIYVFTENKTSVSIDVTNLNSGLHLVKVRSGVRVITNRFNKK